jgi:hypothetical protein
VGGVDGDILGMALRPCQRNSEVMRAMSMLAAQHSRNLGSKF